MNTKTAKTQAELKTAAINALLAKRCINVTVPHSDDAEYEVPLADHEVSTWALRIVTVTNFPGHDEVTVTERYVHNFGKRGWTVGTVLLDAKGWKWASTTRSSGYVR